MIGGSETYTSISCSAPSREVGVAVGSDSDGVFFSNRLSPQMGSGNCCLLVCLGVSLNVSGSGEVVRITSTVFVESAINIVDDSGAWDTYMFSLPSGW